MGSDNDKSAVLSGGSKKCANVCTRLCVVALFVCMAVSTVWLHSNLSALSAEVQEDEGRIAQLQATVDSQAEVIARFGDSVTNSDVLQKVKSLESELTDVETRVSGRMTDTQAEIGRLLNQTINALDRTVQAAQAQIHDEVDKVKKDVDSYVRTTQDQFSMENSFMVYQLAGTFTLISCLISMWHMTAHLRRFRRPSVQRKILAILWMSPIYSVTSWLSLVWPSMEGYLAIIKDFYEAYVIYQFLSFLVSVLGRGDRSAVVDMLAHHADHLDPPYRLCGWFAKNKNPYDTPKHLADAVLLQCQIFAMQFVFLKPLTAITMFTCNKLDYYGSGNSSSDYRSPQFWVIFIQNVSVFLAFSGLLKFYHAVQDDLAWCRPFPKFLCIKGIVFMTFWQGLVIGILANTTDMGGDPQDGSSQDPDIWGKQAQNFLICLEMLLFSIAHFYCFPTEEWEEGYQPVTNDKGSFGDNIAFSDFMQDLKLIVRRSGGKSKRKKNKKGDTTEPATPTGGDEEEGGGGDEGSIANKECKSDNGYSDNDENSNYDDDDDDVGFLHYIKSGDLAQAASHILATTSGQNLDNDDDDDANEVDDESNQRQQSRDADDIEANSNDSKDKDAKNSGSTDSLPDDEDEEEIVTEETSLLGSGKKKEKDEDVFLRLNAKTYFSS